MLTGARRNEVLVARWEICDMDSGVWIKPSAHTKQRKEHRIPLSAPTRQLLTEIRITPPVNTSFPVGVMVL
jgi:integrase